MRTKSAREAAAAARAFKTLMAELSGVVNELYAKRRLKFKRRRVVTRSYDEYAQIDLLDFRNVSRFNSRINFAAVLVNVWSRFSYVEPCKTKSIKDCCEAYGKIFKRLDVKFKNIYCDREKAFMSRAFQDFVHDSIGAKLWFSYTDKKASVCENRIKQIKSVLYKLLAVNASLRWVDYLQEAVKIVNDRVHTRLLKAPSSITKKTAKTVSWFHEGLKRENDVISVPTKFQLNQIVRYCNTGKEIFHKGYLMNYSIRMYKIVSISRKTPNLYTLSDLFSGQVLPQKFYQEQLVAVRDPTVMLIDKILHTDKRRRRVKVSWLGYSDLPAEYIPMKDVFKTVKEEVEMGGGVKKKRGRGRPRKNKKM